MIYLSMYNIQHHHHHHHHHPHHPHHHHHHHHHHQWASFFQEQWAQPSPNLLQTQPHGQYAVPTKLGDLVANVEIHMAQQHGEHRGFIYIYMYKYIYIYNMYIYI